MFSLILKEDNPEYFLVTASSWKSRVIGYLHSLQSGSCMGPQSYQSMVKWCFYHKHFQHTVMKEKQGNGLDPWHTAKTAYPTSRTNAAIHNVSYDQVSSLGELPYLTLSWLSEMGPCKNFPPWTCIPSASFARGKSVGWAPPGLGFFCSSSLTLTQSTVNPPAFCHSQE